MEKRSLVSFFCVLFVCFYNLYQWNPHYRFDLSATFFDASQSYGGMAYFQTPAYNYRNCNLFLFSVSHLLSGWKIMQLLCRQGKKGRAKKNVAVVGTAFLVFYDGIGTAFCRKNVSESVGGIWTVHPFGIGRLCCGCMFHLFSWENLSVRL